MMTNEILKKKYSEGALETVGGVDTPLKTLLIPSVLSRDGISLSGHSILRVVVTNILSFVDQTEKSQISENLYSYSNSSLGLPVCRIMCCITNTETSEWCGTHVVNTLSPEFFLNVMCLPERTSEKPFDFSIDTTLLCGSGRSFPMEDTFWNINGYVGERNRHDRFHVRLDSVGVVEILIYQIPHVFLDFLLGFTLRCNIKRWTGCNEPLALLADKYRERNLYVFHDPDYQEESILRYRYQSTTGLRIFLMNSVVSEYLADELTFSFSFSNGTCFPVRTSANMKCISLSITSSRFSTSDFFIVTETIITPVIFKDIAIFDYMPRERMFNDFLIVACAAINELDIVVSED